MSRTGPQSGRWVVACLVLAQSALLIATAWDKSDTADEIRYLSSGITVLSSGNTRDLCEAPILPKWGFATALGIAETKLASAPSTWQDSMLFLLDGRGPDQLRRMFFTARSATILITILGGLCLWRAASRLGQGVGIAALCLWVFSPTVLANGSLGTLDVWATSMVCVVVLTAVRLYERPTWWRAVVLGGACGLLAGTKVPGLLIVPVGLVVAILFRRAEWNVSNGLVRRLVVAGLAALGVLWTLYRFSIGGIDFNDPCSFVAGGTQASGLWPFPAWFEGLLFQLRHASEGHANYLLGEVNSEGWWSFYLVAMAVKTTLATQALVVLRIASLSKLVRKGEPVDWWLDTALLAFPVALLVMMSAGRHQPNISFLLPAFPLAIMWLARGLVEGERAFGTLGRRLFVALLVAGALESLAVHPHYLMHFNAWAGGPEGGPSYLIHRDDWGQDKRRLAEWQRANNVGTIYYAPYGPNPERWGIVFEPVPCVPTPGAYALHAIEVHRPRFSLQPGCADWLTVEPPDRRIGYSIYVYEVDEARLDRLARDPSVSPFWKSG